MTRRSATGRPMLLSVAAVLAGLVCLAWSADRFVLGASAIAANLGLSPLVVGLLVVGMGTSAPEMVVAALAALDASPGVAIGNAIGSNIANIGLVVGVTAIVTPIAVDSSTLRRQFPLMFVVLALAAALFLDGRLGRLDGVVLVAGFAALLLAMRRNAVRAEGADPLGTAFEAAIPRSVGLSAALAWTVLGLAALLLASRVVVWGAVDIARALAVSDLVIGLTVVAVGTSLPELGVSIASVAKGEPDIAVGNILGSNMFNLLPVLAMPALIAPGEVHGDVLARDLPVLIAFSIVLAATAYGFRGPGRVQRLEGLALLAGFVVYQAAIYRAALA